jgi:two-component sensor histidine kinase
MAQTIALALHELATNAAKYGALSSLAGSLDLSWQERADGLELNWCERSGVPVSPPTHRGFGTKSVIASIETQLGGSAVFDWRSDGLHCRLSVPLGAGERGRRETRSFDASMAGSLVA